jgi:hypothetical protein
MIAQLLLRVFRPDIDTIVSAFGKIEARLEKLIEREVKRRNRNAEMQRSLIEEIDRLERDNDASLNQSDRAARVQQRLQSLTR